MYLRKNLFERLMKFLVILTVFVITVGVSSCAVPEILATVAEKTIEIKVMTYNIYHADHSDPEWMWWANRKSGVVDNIKRLKPDVFGVQEAGIGQIEYLRENLPDYRWYGVGRNDGDDEGQYDAVVFYLNERFDPGDRGTFWFSNHPDTPGSKPGDAWGNPHSPRLCSWVRFTETETNKSFYFYNLHLEPHDHASIGRERSVVLLGERISSRAHPENPFVVVGDFNARSTADEILYLVDDLGYLDAYAEANENLDDSYTFEPWGGGNRKRIDYIFTDPTAIIVSSSVYHWRDSDHFPVTATVLLLVEE